MIGINKNMDVSLSKGAFTLEKTNESGEVYYIRTPGTIRLYPYESITIDTGIRVTLPYGYKGVLKSIYKLDKYIVIDELRIDGTGNESISVTIYSGNTEQYFCTGWERAKGCRIERHICEEYGIMILDDSFFKTNDKKYYTNIINEKVPDWEEWKRSILTK